MYAAAVRDQHDSLVALLLQKIDRGLDARKGFRQDLDVVIIFRLLVQHRHLQRQRVPAVLDQANPQRIGHVDPVRVKAPAVHDHNRPDRLVGLGQDGQKLVIAAFQKNRLTIDDAVDNLVGQALFTLDIRRETRTAEQQQTQ